MLNLTKFNPKLNKKVIYLLLIAILISVLLYFKIDNTNLLKELQNLDNLLLNTHFNLIIWHFLLIAILTFIILIGLGYIFIPLYFIFEFSCIFYQILIFLKLASFKGLLFSLIYNIILKSFYLILIIFFIKKLTNIIKLLIKSFLNKITIDKNILFTNLKALIILFFLIIINDLIIYFWGTKILLKFIFILK